MRLSAEQGRVVLVERDGALSREVLPEAALSVELASALREWARIVEVLVPAVRRPIGGSSGELVSRRGHQLAARMAVELAEPVDYLDPVQDVIIRVQPRVAQQAPTEPTPWATGLTISAVVTVMVAIVIVGVSIALAKADLWVSVVGNLLIGCGLLPSTWLLRGTPTLRWIALGMLAGLLVGWAALLFALLSPASIP